MKKVSFFTHRSFPLLVPFLLFAFLWGPTFWHSARGQTTLNRGDIAFLELSGDAPDRFAFVLLTDVTTSTEIRFTDAGWRGSSTPIGFSTSNEFGVITWTALSNLTAGTVIQISVDNGTNTATPNIGSGHFGYFTGESTAEFSLPTSGDQIVAWQAANNDRPTPGNFNPIAAINGASTGWNVLISSGGAVDGNTTDLYPGLTDGSDAVAVGSGAGPEDEFDNVQFQTAQCASLNNRTATQIRTTINTASNWTGSDAAFGTAFASAANCGSFTVVSGTFPVEWAAFAAELEGETAALRWATASEQNSHFFEVQRSTDGEQFGSVGRVEAAGHSEELRDYRFTDWSPPGGQSYYRLKQVDLDGRFSYSTVVQVQKGEGLAWQVYPNPVSHWLTLSLDQELRRVEVLNPQGQTLSLPVLSLAQGCEIDFSSLPAGIYVLRIATAEQILHVSVQK